MKPETLTPGMRVYCKAPDAYETVVTIVAVTKNSLCYALSVPFEDHLQCCYWDSTEERWHEGIRPRYTVLFRPLGKDDE